MEIVILLVAAGGMYWAFRLITRAGFEAIRSFVYLEALRRGALNAEANGFADLRQADVTPSMSAAVKRYCLGMYAGKQFPLIGEAYVRGMVPNMPQWYGQIAFNWVMNDPKKFIPVQRATLLGVPETEYETYYGNYLREIVTLTGMAAAAVTNKVSKLDDEPCRRAFGHNVSAQELAALFCAEHNLRSDVSAVKVDEGHKTYEEYFQSFLAALTPHFKDAADVERVVGVMKDNRIRSGYENGVHPADVAEQYRDFLGQTILSHARR